MVRPGHTETTSVSLSKEMRALMNEHRVSTTEATRRGVAMILCEKGIPPYNNPLNYERLDKEKKYFLYQKLNEIETLLQIIKKEVINE